MNEVPRIEAVDAFERLLNGSRLPEPRRVLARWVVASLREHLGVDWIDRVMSTNDPIRDRVLAATTHRDGLLSMLEFAIRLQECSRFNGFAKLRDALRTDLRSSLLLHSMLMLEVGALGEAAGASKSFEVLTLGYRSRVDVCVNFDGASIPIEARVILLDDEFRRQDALTDQVQWAVHSAVARHDVAVSVTMKRTPDDVDAVIATIDRAAQLATSTHLSIDLSDDDLSLVAHPEGGHLATRFEGPPIGGDLWTRVAAILRQKAIKRYGPRPVWLRVDLLNGMWAFTPWGQLPLATKADLLARQLRDTLPGDELAGIITSSGCQSHPGYVESETTVSDLDGTIRMRTAIPLGRARETFVVPLHQSFIAEAALFQRLLGQEPTWLEHATRRHNLPSLDSAFPSM